MGKKYCGYCGELLEENCDCEREAAICEEQMVEDYMNSPETHAGWAQEDAIYNSRREQ